jgi:uncharacterized protein YigA (DUF484 family)
MAKTKAKKPSELDEAQVAAWLTSTPDFFTRHPACLTEMELPVDTGPAISLHQYQVRQLREDKVRLSRQLAAFVKNAKTHHKIHSDLLRLSGDMIKLAQSDADLDTYLEALNRHFSLFSVKLLDARHQAKLFKLAVATLAKQDSVCLNQPEPALLEALFGDDAPGVASLAIVAVKKGRKRIACLVLAADDEKRFQPGMGGEFLKLLAQLVSNLVEVP